MLKKSLSKPARSLVPCIPKTRPLFIPTAQASILTRLFPEVITSRLDPASIHTFHSPHPHDLAAIPILAPAIHLSSRIPVAFDQQVIHLHNISATMIRSLKPSRTSPSGMPGRAFLGDCRKSRAHGYPKRIGVGGKQGVGTRLTSSIRSHSTLPFRCHVDG